MKLRREKGAKNVKKKEIIIKKIVWAVEAGSGIRQAMWRTELAPRGRPAMTQHALDGPYDSRQPATHRR